MADEKEKETLEETEASQEEKEETQEEKVAEEKATEESPSKTEGEEDDPLAGLIEEGEGEEGSSKEKNSPPEGMPDLPEDDPLASLLDEESDLPEPEGEEEPQEDEREEDDEAEVAEEKSSRKDLFLTLASILAVFLLLGGGLVTIWYLWQHPPETKLPPPVASPAEPKEETTSPLTSSPIAVEDRKILFLKNFLIPYQRETGEYLFVKAKVLLYYANDRAFTLAKKNEPLLREHIYRLLKNVPLYVWESKKGEALVRKELLSYLTKKEIGGVVPQDLEVTGYILK